MHHHHHDRNALSILAPSVYLIVINLTNGYEAGCAEVRWWRRYIRALFPRGYVPPICLIGSRADRIAKPAPLLAALRDHANADGAELPELSSAFAFDCRGAAWPLRDWYVAQHDQLVGGAPPVPRAIDAFISRKQAWSEAKHGLVKVLPWSEFATRLRREVRDLAHADEYALRAIASYLHDTSMLYLPSPSTRGDTQLASLASLLGLRPDAEPLVIIDVAWFFSSIVTDLIDGPLDVPEPAPQPHHHHGAQHHASHAGGSHAPSVPHPPDHASEASAAPLPTAAPSASLLLGAAAFAGAAADAADDREMAEVEVADVVSLVSDTLADEEVAMLNPSTDASTNPSPAKPRLAARRVGAAAPPASGVLAPAALVPSGAPSFADAEALLPTSGAPDAIGAPDASEPIDISESEANNGLSSAPVDIPVAHVAAASGIAPPTKQAVVRAKQPTPISTVPSLSAQQLAARCKCASMLGEDAGSRLALVMSELGLCAPLATPDVAPPRYTGDDDPAADAETRITYILPPPLTDRAAPPSEAASAVAERVRSTLPVQAARRFVGRSADDSLLVPSLLTRLHARAAQEPAALDEPDSRVVLRDDTGQLLLGRSGACVVVQLVDLPDGRDALDVFACAPRQSSLVYVMLADVLELIRLCIAQCAPGAQTEHHCIGASGLDDASPVTARPTAPIGTVRAACKAGKAAVHFGGQSQSVLALLGEEEVRTTMQAAAAPKPLVPRAAALPQPRASKSPPPPPPKPVGKAPTNAKALLLGAASAFAGAAADAAERPTGAKAAPPQTASPLPSSTGKPTSGKPTSKPSAKKASAKPAKK